MPVGAYIIYIDAYQKSGVKSSTPFELYLEKKPSLYDRNYMPEVASIRETIEIEEDREDTLTYEFLIADKNLDDGIAFSWLLINGENPRRSNITLELIDEYYKFLRIHIKNSTNVTEPAILQFALIDVPPLTEFGEFAYPQLESPEYTIVVKYSDPIDTSGAEKYFIKIEEEVIEVEEPIERERFGARIKSITNLGVMIIEWDEEVLPYTFYNQSLNISVVPSA